MLSNVQCETIAEEEKIGKTKGKKIDEVNLKRRWKKEKKREPKH